MAAISASCMEWRATSCCCECSQHGQPAPSSCCCAPHLLPCVHRSAPVFMQSSEGVWTDLKKRNVQISLKLASSSACSFWCSRPRTLRMPSATWCVCVRLLWYHVVVGATVGAAAWCGGLARRIWLCFLDLVFPRTAVTSCICAALLPGGARSPPGPAWGAHVVYAQGWKVVRSKRCCRGAGALQPQFLVCIICMARAWPVLLPMAGEVRWWVPSQGQWQGVLPNTCWLMTNLGSVNCKLVAGLCISSMIVLDDGFH